MSRPLLLDLFCGAGGCAMGYYRAGFDVIGVDMKPQPRYPFRFVRGDALRPPFDLSKFDAIHASPPCQAFTALRSMPNAREHPDLVDATRQLLIASGLPYVIENVPGAPLRATLMLCGTMFGLRTPCGAELRRHRLFETNITMGLVPGCQHYADADSPIGVFGDHARDSSVSKRKRLVSVDRRRTITVVGSNFAHQTGTNRTQREDGTVRDYQREGFSTAAARIAMGIDWMTGAELSQAIPPAYTEFIGKHLIEQLRMS